MASVQQQSGAPTKGGWITFPFIIATMAGLTLSAGGWTNNLAVYHINEFNIKNIDATQITNIFKGCMNLFPILGATFADSYF
nr:protein NRT1/ PTR FAMILY 2.7-like [Tanacetum cinerariifolium]